MRVDRRYTLAGHVMNGRNTTHRERLGNYVNPTNLGHRGNALPSPSELHAPFRLVPTRNK